jgi:lipoyl-dependent peroxiredoxin
MPKADRQAQVVWNGNLFEGKGTIISTGSGAFGTLPVSWAARTESSDGKTSPEELLAMAHAACYAMALSNTLDEAGHPPEELRVSAVCTFEPPRITTMKLDVAGRVPGIDQAEFERIASQANQGCPVSNALRNNVDIQVTARLNS